MLFISSLALTLQPFVGVGDTDLSWNIAGSNGRPNVLSELQFESMRDQHWGLQGRLDLALPGDTLQVFIEAEHSDGSFEQGRGSDADYQADNRRDIGSLSQSKVRGDERQDSSVALGLGAKRGAHHLALMVGHRNLEQDINLRHGRQILVSEDYFPLGSIDELTAVLQQNLNSNYLAEWSADWLGADYEYHWSNWTLGLRLQAYRGDYYGEGRWNLRAEGDFALQQPRSFSHSADAAGRRLQASLGYQFNEDLGLELSVSRSRWESDAGSALIFFADGEVAETRFNQAELESEDLRLGISYRF